PNALPLGTFRHGRVKNHLGEPADMLVSPMVPGAQQLIDAVSDPGRFAALRGANPPSSLAAMRLGNYLVGGDDRHFGNYLVEPEGEVVPIDYGASFYPHPSNQWNWGREDALADPNILPASTPLDMENLERILDNRKAIEEIVNRDVLPHYAPKANWPTD